MTFSAHDRAAPAWSKAVRNGIARLWKVRLARRIGRSAGFEVEPALLRILKAGQLQLRLALPSRDAILAIGFAGPGRQEHCLDRPQPGAAALRGVFEVQRRQLIIQAAREGSWVAGLAGELDEGPIAAALRIGEQDVEAEASTEAPRHVSHGGAHLVLGELFAGDARHAAPLAQE